MRGRLPLVVLGMAPGALEMTQAFLKLIARGRARGDAEKEEERGEKRADTAPGDRRLRQEVDHGLPEFYLFFLEDCAGLAGAQKIRPPSF
jgi:hypothetical protein